jgi:hypothetical protein
MAEIKTFAGFKDWLLLTFFAALLVIASDTWMNVNELKTQAAIDKILKAEKDREDAKVRSDISQLQQEVKILNEYIKPEETRVRRRIVDR